MARKRDRFFALFGALLFLITSSALTIAVIYTLVQQHKDSSPSSSQDQSSQTQTNTNNKEAKLEGTPLSGFTPISKVDQLQAVDLTPGTGAEVKAGDKISVDYTGAIASTGTIFQSSKDSGQKFDVVIGKGNVIKGWDEGIPGMKVGGTRRLVIPAALAYGASSPAPNIPANSDLVFDVTVYSISQ